MRFRKILLVNLYYKESGYGDRLNFPPVGLGYLSQYLEMKHIQHDIFDIGAGYSQEELLEKICNNEPDLIGFSVNSVCFPKSLELIRRVKNRSPQVVVVVGGPHISTEQESILEENIEIDYAIIKEGEIPLALLCNGEAPADIPGFIWRNKEGIIIRNPPQLQAIDDLPYPLYGCFDIPERYEPKSISIITSRGCPFKCIFCQQSSLLGKKWRGRKAQSVVDEIDHWFGRGFSSIHILDDNFALDKKRLWEISQLISARSMKGLELHLIGGLRIQGMTQETLSTLLQMGVRYISFGVESGSNKILKFIRKGITADEANSVIKMAIDMGFFVRLFFIIGFPLETMEDVQESFALALCNRVHEVRFFNLVPYKHTGIMLWIQENGGTLLYSYEEYMSDFKRFQRLPLFDAPGGMSLEEKRKALHMAEEVIAQVRDK